MVVQSSKGLVSEIDAILEIREPDGLSSEIIVEVKTNPVEPRLVSSLVSHLKRLSLSRYNELGQVGTIPVPMLVSTYLSPLTRERLTEAGIGYADSTGNNEVSLLTVPPHLSRPKGQTRTLSEKNVRFAR